jgi:hypothetical protein
MNILLSYFEYRQIWLNILMYDLPLEQQRHKIEGKRKSLILWLKHVMNTHEVELIM